MDNIERNKLRVILNTRRREIDLFREIDNIRTKTTQIVRYKKRAIINNKTQRKSTKILPYLGCTSQDFINYIESLFHSGMQWINHEDLWEIDHVMPFVLCNSLENIYNFSNYLNIKPELKSINRKNSTHRRAKNKNYKQC